MARPRGKVVLVFGENDNDRRALVEIAKALKPRAKVRFDRREKPLVLLSSAETRETRETTAAAIARLVAAASVIDDVVAVIAHRDCDAVEPAHIDLAKTIETELKSKGIKKAIAAAPAFEMEAWWLLFPEAVHRTCPSWERISISNRNVGSISNAKEFLTRALRPKAKGKIVRDYRESDSIRISELVRELGLINEEVRKRCASLDEFCIKMEKIRL